MSKGLGDIIYAAVKKAFGDEEGYDDLKKPYGLEDTIYTATRKAINNEDYDGSDSKPVGLGDTIYAAVKKASDELGGIGGGGGGGGATITVIELVGDDPADQPSFKVETIGGEQIDVASTTVVVDDVEMPAYTFNATAGDVIVISVTDENLTFNADSVGGSWYSSAFNLPRTNYPSLIDEQEGQMTLVAASGDSCVFASLTSRSQ